MIVDWLMNRTVREVSGASVRCRIAVGEQAAVRALATAPSMANTSVVGVGDGRQHVGLDAHAEDAAVAIDDGDDRVLARRGGRGAA